MTASRTAIAGLAFCAAVALAGCGSDDPPVSTAASTPPATALAPTTSNASPTPSVAASPSSTARSSARPTSAKPSAQPTDDENGELAGQLIIEYPGKPLKRTTSTSPNSDVRDMQIRLNEVGYPVATSGVFDLKTERVVKRFQRDNGLTADGIVGPNTWAALFTFEGAAG